MIAIILYKLYAIDNVIFRKILRRIMFSMEGGALFARTVREVYSNYHNIEIGMYSYGGCFDLKNIPSGTKIGRYGSFSTFKAFPRNHPIDFLSMHPFFYNPELGFVNENKIPYTKLDIGHDVWIGYNAFIMPKVSSIGNGAVIGAGAVVTKNVPPFAVIVGNPGKIVKYRFPKELRENIEESAWWGKDINELEFGIKTFTMNLDWDSNINNKFFERTDEN